MALKETAGSLGLEDDSPLVHQLCIAASYLLTIERSGRGSSCQLGPVPGGSWPPEIGSASTDTLELWRVLAAGASTVSAIARFEDLLFCRKDGNGRTRATRAADAYLAAIDATEMTGQDVDGLLRAWTLARAVREVSLDRRVRDRLAQEVDGMMSTTGGTKPGVVVPMLAALGEGPVGPKKGTGSSPDHIDVDAKLASAASLFSCDRHSAKIAKYRRSRTQDPSKIEVIDSDEIQGYIRAADASPNAAVRMVRLQQAARAARDRGLTDLVRSTTSMLQAIDPTELGLVHFREEIATPRYDLEPWLGEFTRSPDWQDGLQWFLLTPPPTGELRHLKQLAGC